GAPVSPALLHSVLSDLTALRIRGGAAGSTGRLATVSLTRPLVTAQAAGTHLVLNPPVVKIKAYSTSTPQERKKPLAINNISRKDPIVVTVPTPASFAVAPTGDLMIAPN